MREVYRAQDTRLDREIAVIVLPEHLANDADALTRFEREAKAVVALSHPNILAIYDVGGKQGISFAATELLEGETLHERLRGSTKTPGRHTRAEHRPLLSLAHKIFLTSAAARTESRR